MGKSRHANEFLEITGNELRAIVRNDARASAGIFFHRPLDDCLHLFLGHGSADFMMDDCTGTAVQDRAKIIKGASNVDVTHVDMPMLVGM